MFSVLFETAPDGDERYMMARDKGPVKRFVRDFVDARLSIAELLLPILVLALILQSAGSESLMNLGSSLMTTTILVVFADSSFANARYRSSTSVNRDSSTTQHVAFGDALISYGAHGADEEQYDVSAPA